MKRSFIVFLLCLAFYSCQSSKSVVDTSFHDGYITHLYKWGTRVEFKDFQIDLPQGWWVQDYHERRSNGNVITHFEDGSVQRSDNVVFKYWGSFVTDDSNDSTKIEFMWSTTKPFKAEVPTSSYEPNGFPTRVYSTKFGEKLSISINAHIFPANHWFVLHGSRLTDKEVGVMTEILNSFRLREDDAKKRGIKQY